MAPSIKDVAKLAGVTNGTVSRAFNEYADIRSETKERIMDAAKKLGYTPNVSARSLSSKRPPNIGLIISGLLEGDSKDNLVYLILQGVFQYALTNKLEVALYTTDSVEQREKSYIRFCREHTLSGAILSGITTDDAYLGELMDSDIPSVAIDVPIQGCNAGWVSIDNCAAAKEMARYLIRQGHRRIVVVNGKKNAAVNQVRLAGVEEAFAQEGIHIPRERMLYGHFSEEGGYKSAKRYLAAYADREATAFFCFSDIMALGVMRAIRESGYRVPEDFSVVGFDGLPLTELVVPALTTIQQDMRRMGHECAAMLHGMMQGTETGGHRVIPYRFVERASVQKVVR